jgi:BolA protein
VTTTLQEQIHERLAALNPTQLDIIDESHLHSGHAGARGGARHLRIVITSSQFDGMAPLARHRLVYDRMHDLIPYPIHALAIVAKAT